MKIFECDGGCSLFEISMQVLAIAGTILFIIGLIVAVYLTIKAIKGESENKIEPIKEEKE